jgi:hypothetical protein
MKDYGKKERLLFLERIKDENKWGRYTKWLLIFMIIYFGTHIAIALASQPVIISTPDGGQRVCIVDGRYITCF